MVSRVLVTASDLIWRNGLERLSRDIYPDASILICANRRECLTGLTELQPDLITIRCCNRGMSCPELIQRMITMNKRARILAIGEGMDLITATRLRNAGALGLLSNLQNLEQLREAMQAVARGIHYMDDVMSALFAESNLFSDKSPFAQLTQREYQVLGLILEGKQTAVIAAALNLSGKTVANHHSAILHKLGVSNNVDLTKLALRHRLITSD